MERITKTEVTAKLNNLKKIGYKVFTFNSNRYVNAGTKGFPDHVILIPKTGYVVLCEVKLYKDKQSDKQIEFQEVMESIGTKNPMVIYELVTEKNLESVFNKLLSLGGMLR